LLIALTKRHWISIGKTCANFHHFQTQNLRFQVQLIIKRIT
jgi:hypothetical protein